MVSYCKVDIFESYGDFKDGNEEDCNHIDDLGVEAAKGITSLIPHCNQPR